MVESIVSFAVERLGDLLIEEATLLHGADEDERLQNWISEIRNIALHAEDVIEFYALKVAHGRSIGIQNLLRKSKHLHNVGFDIKSIQSRISDLTRSLQTYGLNAIRDKEDSTLSIERQQQLRWSYSHIVEEFIVGLDEDINQLVGWLVRQDKHNRVVFICGMGGLGKATLANKIYHHNTIRR
ncbi:hypothetical protein L6164_012116 [Bauhinia variegata]|uniref:Uncharacterized protein n=1 Tax=Bauhinia variegata TaxID=167791 RepID=A0ACB9P7Z9_BAUVA|nr:hypothetical protein L6164_012116 [Bauhinia variegata]